MKLKLFFALLLVMLIAGCATAPRPLPPERIGTPSTYHAFVPAAKGLFVWPVNGYTVSSFGSKVGRVINKGIDIKSEFGADVKAAKAGKVVYCDPYLKGFGKTIILDHGNGYQTVYAYNSDILARVGEQVEQNQTIAKVGKTGRASEPMLHFEVRRNGEPQNPDYYLSGKI